MPIRKEHLFMAARSFVVLLLSIACAQAVSAATEVDVYLFWREGCPHCEKEIAFLRQLQAREPRVRLHTFELGERREHRQWLARVAKQLNVTEIAVPFTVIGQRHLVGYDSDSSTGAALEALIHECLAQTCADVVKPLREVGQDGGKAEPSSGAVAGGTIPERLRVPLLGEIETKNLSLPLLTIVLGALDGFNPCAMWVLVFLIGLLGGMRDRTRAWVLGGAFIIASSVVYYLFMAAWLNLLLFLGMIVWVRAAVAVAALAGGAYYLREFFVNREAVCKVTAPERRRRVFERLKESVYGRNFWIALTGIAGLALAVNLVELLCSAGIPAVYTQVLALSKLPTWQYHAYLLLYILVFMLDDLIVFGAAMIAVEAVGLGSRYVRWSHLAGGMVLLAIGALLLLRPQWLVFSG